MVAIALQPGDEVIVPSMTFAASANAVIHAGGRPVLADVDRATMCLDLADVERRVTPRTRALMPVHFAGRACAMDRLLDLARAHRLQVIEDCAHAIETTYHGRHAGTMGELGAFSFYATKNLATGEGGMVTTADPARAARIKTLALHGLNADAWKRFSDQGFKHYEVTEPGFKYNMMDLQAALGIHQLARVERCWKRRCEIWDAYCEGLRGLPVFLPKAPDAGTRHAHHLFTLLLDLDRVTLARDEFLERMTSQKIGVGVHYRAVHLHPFYQERYGYRAGQFPAAEWISDRTVSLPLSPKLTDQDVRDVIQAVERALGA